MKAMITGVTGFIGGALANALVEKGWQVRVLVRPASRNKLPGAERFEVVEADLGADSPALEKAAAGCDVVVHAAAIRNRWGTSKETYRQTNVEGTQRLLAACEGRAQRFVYVSSVGVLGQPGVHDINESFPVLPHKDNYHDTKAQAEQLTLSHQGSLETVIARPTITYGPGDGDGMMTRLIELIARRRFIRVGRGANHFHLTYIDDLIRGLILTMTHSAAHGNTFILAGPESIAVGRMVALIQEALGLPPQPFFLPECVARPVAWGVEGLYKAGAHLGVLGPDAGPPITRDKIDILCVHRGYSFAKAMGSLGYVPQIGYPEGLAKTLAWMKEARGLKVPGVFVPALLSPQSFSRGVSS